jgi:hypothetical protein
VAMSGDWSAAMSGDWSLTDIDLENEVGGVVVILRLNEVGRRSLV